MYNLIVLPTGLGGVRGGLARNVFLGLRVIRASRTEFFEDDGVFFASWVVITVVITVEIEHGPLLICMCVCVWGGVGGVCPEVFLVARD